MKIPSREVILNFVLGFLLVATVFSTIMAVAAPNLWSRLALFSTLIFWDVYTMYKLRGK